MSRFYSDKKITSSKIAILFVVGLALLLIANYNAKRAQEYINRAQKIAEGLAQIDVEVDRAATYAIKLENIRTKLIEQPSKRAVGDIIRDACSDARVETSELLTKAIQGITTLQSTVTIFSTSTSAFTTALKNANADGHRIKAIEIAPAFPRGNVKATITYLTLKTNK